MDKIFFRDKKGFTLIELIIVIIILGVLSVGIYINWSGVPVNVSAQANQIANDIRYTQALSMSKGERYRIVFSSASYQITNSSGTPITLPLGGTTETLTNGASFGAFTNLPNNLIVFNGEGTPYVTTALPGTPLASTATIPVVGGGSTKVISITPQTGRVTVS